MTTAEANEAGLNTNKLIKETEPAVVAITTSVQEFLQDVGIAHSPATVATYKVALSRFVLYLALSQLCPAPTEAPTAILKTDWAIDFLRWVAAGQPEHLATAPSEAISSKGMKRPHATIATYGAALSRFYTWCGTERRLELPADEHARFTRRLNDLRGKVQRSIINKVPADEVLDKLLAQARKSRTTSLQPAPALAAAAIATTAPDTLEAGAKQEVKAKHSDNKENAAQKTGIPPSTAYVNKGLAAYDAKRKAMLHSRNIALLEILKSSGARVSELCGLTVGDVDNTNHRARVVGKGSKERWIYFSPQAWEALSEYLQVRYQQMRVTPTNSSSLDKTTSGNTDAAGPEPKKRAAGSRARARRSEAETQPLFARHDRGSGLSKLKPMAARTIENMLWELVEEAGLEVYITPHKFRHWFATRVLAATGDLAVTQDLLGHANPATTRIYAQVSETKKQAAHHQVFQ